MNQEPNNDDNGEWGSEWDDLIFAIIISLFVISAIVGLSRMLG